jgi:transcriptional regulator with XRE-family HTH domain
MKIIGVSGMRNGSGRIFRDHTLSLWSLALRHQPERETKAKALERLADCLPKDAVMVTKSPNATDTHVGKRVRMRRLMLDMSQTNLGDALGLTFQQVQKYEKGANRIGASRLQHIAHILQVPVRFFFEGSPGAAGEDAPTPTPSYVDDFLATSDGLSLIKYFTRIKEPKLRRSIVDLVEQIPTHYS